MKDMNSMKVILYTCNRMDICQTSKTAYLCDICEDIYNFTELKLMRNKFKKWMIYLLRKHVVKDDQKREQRDNKTLKLCYLNWWNSMWIAFQDLVIYWGYKKCTQCKEWLFNKDKNKEIRADKEDFMLVLLDTTYFNEKVCYGIYFQEDDWLFRTKKENTSKLTCLTV